MPAAGSPPTREPLALLSVAAFAAPLTVALLHDALRVHAVLLAGVIVCSTLYHARRTPIVAALDNVFAWALMLWQLVLCAEGHFVFPPFFAVLILVPLALSFYFRRARQGHDLDHALWHVTSAAVALACQLTFLSGSGR